MALKLDNNPGQVYDPEPPKSDGSHDDGAISPGEQAKFDQIEAGERDLADLEKNASDSDGNKTASNEAEAGMSDSAAKANGKSPIKVNLPGSKKSSKGKKIIGGVAVGLVLSAVGAMLLLPSVLMKTITEKLTDTFIGRAKYAVEQRAELYVSRYVTNVIGGTMRTCPGTKISRDCVAIDPGKNTLFGIMATNWSQNRLESKLFTKYGIEFELDPNDSNKINVIKNGEPLGEFGKRSVSREVVNAVNTETKFEGILTRRHIRSVLASKYGANKWCFIACSKRDQFDDAKIRGVKKIKLKMIARVSEISSARTTAYLLCLTTGCSDAELERNDKELVDQILKRSDTELVESLAKDIKKYGTRDLSELVTRKIVDKIVTAALNEVAAEKALGAIPVAGQIYLAATVAELLTVADDKIKNGEISEFLREINIQETALYATQITTMADDNQSMDASIEDSWASFQYLNGFAKSRVWQGMNNVENKTTVNCEDGVVLSEQDDPLTCPEFNVQPTLGIEEFRNNPSVDAFATAANAYTSCFGTGFIPGSLCPDEATPRYWIKGTLNIINSTLGAVSGAIIDGIEFLPGIGNVLEAFQNFVADYAMQFFEWASKKLFPRLVNGDAEDEVAFDQAAVGYDVLGNTFAKGEPETPDASGIGGSVLSGTQQASLDYAIAIQKREDMQSESFFARYFDFDNPDSLVASATLDTTSLFMGGSPQMLDQIKPSNFISNIASIFGVETRAYALNVEDRANLFGITQYGYAVDDTNLAIDPLSLTPEQCAVFAQARLKSAFPNLETGETDYTVTNPCALDSIVTDSLTKIFDLDDEGAVTGTAGPGTAISNEVDCTGYTEVFLERKTRKEYSASIKSQCETLKNECQNVGTNDPKKIICSALKFDGVYYGNGYSATYAGANANKIYGFTASSGNYGLSPESWIARRSEGLSPNNLLECSGLTSVALHTAFNPGVNVGCSGNWNDRANPLLFRQLQASEIRPGDFLTKTYSCNSNSTVGGHIAIAASTADASGNIIVYETNSWGKPVRFTAKNLQRDFGGAWSRYIGPGTK